MRTFATLARRELSSYFYSLAGYIIIASVLGLIGLSFWQLLEAVRGESTPVPITELFFNTMYFWIIILLSVPVITMRLFALEKYSGTFETLMTAPVSDMEVVSAKFFAAMTFYALMWVPLIGCILILRRYASDASVVDWGTLGSTFFGILLIGLLFIAIGCFASAVTRNQIVAAIITMVAAMTFMLLSFLGKTISSSPEWVSDVLNYISMFDHMEDFSRGVVDTRHLAYYLSSALFFLFLTYRVVESRRWK